MRIIAQKNVHTQTIDDDARIPKRTLLANAGDALQRGQLGDSEFYIVNIRLKSVEETPNGHGLKSKRIHTLKNGADEDVRLDFEVEVLCFALMDRSLFQENGGHSFVRWI